MATQTYTTLTNIPIPLVRNLLLLLQLVYVDRRDLRLIGQSNGEFKVEFRINFLCGHPTATIWLFSRLCCNLHVDVGANIGCGCYIILELRHLHRWCHIILHFKERITTLNIVVVGTVCFVVASVDSGSCSVNGGGGGGGSIERTVSLRINSTAVKLSLDVCVPVVLYLIISSSW